MKVAQRPCQPWFCCETAEAKTSRGRLERKWRRTGLEADRLIFVEARNNVSKLISAAKTSFYSRRSFWQSESTIQRNESSPQQENSDTVASP